jgi:tetratricopeptide (TPR) repeat protein
MTESLQGQYFKALSYYEKAIEIRQKETLAENHPDLATTFNNICQLYSKMGEQSEAVSFYERAIDIGQRSLPENHPHLQMYRENLKFVRKNLRMMWF